MKSRGMFLSRLFVFALISIVWAENGFAQQIERKIIGNVVVAGNVKNNADIIKLNSGLFTGKEVSGEDFADAIKRLWNMRSFSHIEITAENPKDRVINIIIKLREYPQLDNVAFEGNNEIDTEKLSETVGFYRNMLISPNKILAGKRKIVDLYQGKGYLLATVTIDSSRVATTDKLVVVYRIDEGQKVKIKKISFEGNTFFSSGKLRKQFKKTKQDGIFRGGDFNKAEYENDKKLIEDFYKKNGFRDAEVVSDSIYYDNTKKHMYIIVRVNEGDRYYFRNIEFEGNDEEKFPSSWLRMVLDIKKGDIFDAEKLNKGKMDLNKLYNDRGYLLAQINYPDTPVGKDSLDIKISINENNPVTINQIEIKGNTKTKEKVIRREIKSKPGDIFSQELLVRSYRDIMMLNYFAAVKPNIGTLINDEKVDLVFTVEEKSTDTANMSAGYSQRDGMIGSLGLTMNNLFGNGQQLNLDWQFGRIFRVFQIGFTEPFLFDTPTLAGFSVYDLRRGGPFYGYTQESVGATFRVGRRLRWPDDRFRGDWYFEYSKNRYSNFNEDDPRRFYIGLGFSDRVSITQVITRDSRGNNPEFPIRGALVSLSTQFAGGFLGGTEDYVKNIFKSEWYFNTFWKFVLYSSSEFGVIRSFNNDTYIAPQELFFMGGSALSFGTMLRGYRERSVGPLSSSGTPLGGKAMLKFTTEFRFPVSENPTIYGLLFAEAGNNWLETAYMDPFDLRRSVGVGVRLFLPMVGMIGLDFGYGFDQYGAFGQKQGKWMPHFQFGRGF